MKRQELLLIGLTAFVAAIFAIILSGVILGSPKKNPIKVPVVNAINSSFPDVKNQSNYNTVFNGQALDPTQLIQIGNNNNQALFQGSSQ